MDERTLSASDLHELCLALLRGLDTPDDLAAIVAQALRNANLAGHDSHGLVRMPAYAQSVRDGKVIPQARAEVVRSHGATAAVSARRGWGQPAGRVAADTAVSLAHQHGVGAVVLQESPHVGRLADYAERVAGAGQLAMIVTNAWVNVAPFGGRDRRLGTNPIAFGIPRGTDQPPIVSDFATSVVAEGKLQVARAYGRPVAPGTIVDSEGRPTEDPEDFYGGGALLPAQGYKGYGLAVAIEALGGALSGMAPAMLPSYGDGNGMFVLALQIDAFVALEQFVGQVEEMAAALVAAPTAPDADEILLPGDVELRTTQRRARDGVPIPGQTWEEVVALAGELGVAVPS
ncbi:MAG: Ldh family oxidoreductase [Solirubrobacteraceae bacterium]